MPRRDEPLDVAYDLLLREWRGRDGTNLAKQRGGVGHANTLTRIATMIWLGPKAGYLSDWLTQQWVCATGRCIDLVADPWLDGVVGKPTGIGLSYFDDLASERGWQVQRGGGVTRGLIKEFASLASPSFDPSEVHPDVVRFYERSSEYDLDAWSQWCGFFKPLGGLLALLFSRRLQQLNVPLSGLDTSRGIKSEIVQLVDPASGEAKVTAWVRQLLGTQNVLYAGSYSICRPTRATGPCVRVVFPLPNGNAIVIMRPHLHGDGSFSVISRGDGFGDAGFYFTVHRGDRVRARYVRAMREEIRVYPAGEEQGGVRADHTLWFAGMRFLQLHYRLRRNTSC
jgi:hypothetical protein